MLRKADRAVNAFFDRVFDGLPLWAAMPLIIALISAGILCGVAAVLAVLRA